MLTQSALTHAAGQAVSVTETVQLSSTVARTWDVVKDFTRWQAWHPAFASTDITRGDGRSEGSIRILTTKDGGRFTEELVKYDPAARSYRYRIIDSPAPVADYVSTIEVVPSPTGSAVLWTSTFKVKAGTSEADAKALISGVYRAGLDNLPALAK